MIQKVRAPVIDTAAVTSNTVAVGAVTSNSIANGSVTNVKLAEPNAFEDYFLMGGL